MVMGAEGDRVKGAVAGKASEAAPYAVAGLVYLVTNLVNGKEYVGQTRSTIGHRWAQHCLKARKGGSGALHNAIRKYGAQNFSIVMLEEVTGNRADLLTAEAAFIERRGSTAPLGYNLSLGGEGVDFSNSLIRAKHHAAILASHDEEWRANQYLGAQKRLADADWRKNNAQALARVHASPEWRRRHAEVLHELHSNPEYVARCREGIRRRSENACWRENQAAAMKTLHADPEFVARRAAMATERAVKRDALCVPEVARRRQQRRQRAAAKRAGFQGTS